MGTTFWKCGDYECASRWLVMAHFNEERRVFEEVAGDLLAAHGPVLKSEVLWRALGFGSRSAFNRGIASCNIKIPLFPMPTGRGRYALTRDVARYLTKLRMAAAATSEEADQK